MGRQFLSTSDPPVEVVKSDKKIFLLLVLLGLVLRNTGGIEASLSCRICLWHEVSALARI